MSDEGDDRHLDEDATAAEIAEWLEEDFWASVNEGISATDGDADGDDRMDADE